MRALPAWVILFAALPLAAADWKGPAIPGPMPFGVTVPIVDLDAPGALERLAQENPGHFRRITRMLEVAQNASCEDRAQIHRAQAASEGLACSHALFKASLPPKREVVLPIDGVTYRKTLVIERFAKFLDRE